MNPLTLKHSAVKRKNFNEEKMHVELNILGNHCLGFHLKNVTNSEQQNA